MFECTIFVPHRRSRSRLQHFSKLVQRVTKEFIGFHGTNSKTAALWEAQGNLVKPKEAGANSDKKQQGNSRSGADEELGVGLYVADAITTAEHFANTNQQNNPGTTKKICAIYTKDPDSWKKLNKVQVPDTLVRRSIGVTAEVIQAAQTCYLGLFGSPPFSPKNTLVFSYWGSAQVQSGQVLIPEGYNPYFTAECFDPDAKLLPPGAFLPGPNELFHSSQRISAWSIKSGTTIQAANCLAKAKTGK